MSPVPSFYSDLQSPVPSIHKMLFTNIIYIYLLITRKLRAATTCIKKRALIKHKYYKVCAGKGKVVLQQITNTKSLKHFFLMVLLKI